MSENISGPPVALMERLSFLLKRTFALLEAEGPTSQQRLAERIGVDRTTMVALIDALEKKQLVIRHRDPCNRRAYVLEVTAAGHKKLRHALKAVQLAEQEALAPLSAMESATLTRALQRLVQAGPIDSRNSVSEVR